MLWNEELVFSALAWDRCDWGGIDVVGPVEKRRGSISNGSTLSRYDAYAVDAIRGVSSFPPSTGCTTHV